MSISSLGLRTTNLTITQACWELRSPATVRPKVLELSIIQATGTAQSLGLGRPQAQGVTPVNVLFQCDDLLDGGGTSVMNASLSWATSPTVPLIFHRRWNSAATIGVGMVWTFPRGLVLPVSASLVIWNITTAVACDVNCVLDE
jgi:hypothetical protein